MRVVAVRQEDADTAEKRAKVNPISRWYKPWWYTHVQDLGEAGEEVVEYVPLRHYILRHNRAIFWTLQDMIPPWFGNHPVFRMMFGWMVPPAISLLKYLLRGMHMSILRFALFLGSFMTSIFPGVGTQPRPSSAQ